jgi:hypothetical protein
MARSGSYATRGSRTGLVSIVPRDPVLDWYPEFFEGHYAFAKQIVSELLAHGFLCRAGTAAAASVAACHHVDPDRARDAMRSMIERMIVNGH